VSKGWVEVVSLGQAAGGMGEDSHSSESPSTLRASPGEVLPGAVSPSSELFRTLSDSSFRYRCPSTAQPARSDQQCNAGALLLCCNICIHQQTRRAEREDMFREGTPTICMNKMLMTLPPWLRSPRPAPAPRGAFCCSWQHPNAHRFSAPLSSIVGNSAVRGPLRRGDEHTASAKTETPGMNRGSQKTAVEIVASLGAVLAPVAVVCRPGLVPGRIARPSRFRCSGPASTAGDARKMLQGAAVTGCGCWACLGWEMRLSVGARGHPDDHWILVGLSRFGSPSARRKKPCSGNGPIAMGKPPTGPRQAPRQGMRRVSFQLSLSTSTTAAWRVPPSWTAAKKKQARNFAVRDTPMRLPLATTPDRPRSATTSFSSHR